MSPSQISNRVERFIFEHVDSINVLEALLLFHSEPTKHWTFNTLATELRSNQALGKQCISKLLALNLVAETSAESGEFVYKVEDQELKETIDELAAVYRIQRHNIYSLIFSPLKKARDFAEAFRLGKNKKEGGDG